MNYTFPESSVLIRSLGWTLMHSLWQGAIIAACLWVSLKLLQSITSRIKYHLCLASFLVLASWFAVTWIQQWQRLQTTTVHVTAATRETGVEHSYTVAALPPDSGTELWLRHFMPNMEHAFPLLVMIYLAGLGLMLVRFGFGFGKLLQTRYAGIRQADPYWLEKLNTLCDRLEIAQKVKLLYSARINMPMMLGIIKPVIILPIATLSHLDTDQIEAILLHELAHIKRQDYLINILQIVIETALFFNPFMWWISAGIRREREHCCDDHVLAQTQQPLPYATALAALETFRNASKPFALAAGGQHHYLFNRIKRITEMKKNPLNYGRMAAALLIVGAIGFSVAWFSPALAQNRKAKEKTDSHSTTSQHVIIIDDKGNRKEYNNVNGDADTTASGLYPNAFGLRNMTGNGSHWVADNDYLAYEDSDAHYAPEAPIPPMPPMSGIAPVPPIPPMPAMHGDRIASQALDEANKALAAIDWKAIDESTREALKNADKAIAKANESLKNIDWRDIDRQVEQAMKEVDAVDWDAVSKAGGNAKSSRELKKEIREKVANAKRHALDEIAAAREEGRTVREQVREEMNEARMSAQEAREEARERAEEARGMRNEYTDMLREMESDGLIDQKRGFVIMKNNSDLYINRVAQPDNVKVKYRHYFQPGKVKISGKKNSLSISATNES